MKLLLGCWEVAGGRCWGGLLELLQGWRRVGGGRCWGSLLELELGCRRVGGGRCWGRLLELLLELLLGYIRVGGGKCWGGLLELELGFMRVGGGRCRGGLLELLLGCRRIGGGSSWRGEVKEVWAGGIHFFIYDVSWTGDWTGLGGLCSAPGAASETGCTAFATIESCTWCTSQGGHSVLHYRYFAVQVYTVTLQGRGEPLAALGHYCLGQYVIGMTEVAGILSWCTVKHRYCQLPKPTTGINHATEYSG